MGKLTLYDPFDHRYYEIDEEEDAKRQKEFFKEIEEKFRERTFVTYGEVYEALHLPMNRKMRDFENLPVNFDFSNEKGQKIIYEVYFIDTVKGESFSWEYDSLDEAIERINNEKTLAITYVKKITREQD